MNPLRRFTPLVLAGLLCGAGHADVNDGAPPPDELLLYERWGALRARPRLQLLDIGWDSNVFSSQQETGDYRATVAPGLEGLILFGNRAFLRFDSEARYTAYSRYSELNYFDLQNAARANVALGNWTLYVGGGYDRERKTPVDLDDVRPVYVTARGELGTIVQMNRWGSLELAYGYRDLNHEDDDFARQKTDIGTRLDRVVEDHLLTYRHPLGGRTALSVKLEGSRILFDTPNISGADGLERDSRAIRILPGFSLGQGGRWSGRLEAGYAQLEYDSAELSGYAGSIGRAELRFRPFADATLTLKGLRDVSFAAGEGNDYYVRTGARLNMLYFLNPLIGLELETARGELEFPASGRADDLAEYWGGVRLLAMQDRYGRQMMYRVKVGHRERDSNEPHRDRSQAAISIDAVFGY